jgi:flagella basal body P-ring formation protein FlgA
MNWIKFSRLLFLLPVCLNGDTDALLASILEPLTRNVVTVDHGKAEKGNEEIRLIPVVDDIALITPEMVLATIEAQLTARCQLSGKLALSFMQPCPIREVSSNEWSLELGEIPPTGPASRMVVECILKDGQTIRTYRLLLQAQLFQEVYISRRSLNREEALDPVDFERAIQDVLLRRSPMVSTETQLKSYELIQALPSGQPLYWKAVIPKPIIRKGQVVEVQATEGLLFISTKAVALENGLTGDIVNVRNLNTRKEFQAQVINESTLKVHF